MERAALIRSGSTFLTPLMVFSRMAHCTPQYTMAILETSLMPKKTMNTGNRAMVEVCRKVWRSGSI
ncbi:hypothetical protein D3C81_2208730 [compost metagenome]